MSIRELLNQHRWHHDDLHDLDIVVRHRGAPDDQRVLSGAAVSDIGPKAIGFASWEAEDGLVWIPYHRVLVIRTDAAVLWEKPQ